MSFARTTSGLKNKYLFYDVPIIFVEGITDKYIFQTLLSNKKCRIELMGSKSQSKELIDGIINDNNPYVVVIDGDYDFININKNLHRRTIMLRKYSIENYLWDKDIIEKATIKYTGSDSTDNILENTFEMAEQQICKHLIRLVEYDIASQIYDQKIKVLPKNIDELINKKDICSFDLRKLQSIIEDAKISIKKEYIRESKKMLKEFLRKNKFTDIVKGHYLFGIIRRIFCETVKRINGRKPTFDITFLYHLLSDLLWVILPTTEHKYLKRKITEAISDANKCLASTYS